MGNNLFKRKERLKEVLPGDLYLELLSFYMDILFSHEYQFVVPMARKSYVLFQSFLPILKEDTTLQVKPIITSDRVFGLYKESVNRDTKLLIVDDTMLYGRTVKEFVERLHGAYRIPYQNIELAVYAAAYERREKREDLPYFQNGCYHYRNDDGEKVSIKTFRRTPVFAEIGTVRRYSSRFLDAIRSTSTPFVSYIPGFTVTESEWESSIEPKLSEKKWEKYDITLHNDAKDEEWLISYCYIPMEKPIKQANFSCIRIYRNLKMRNVLFVPYIVLPFYQRNVVKEDIPIEIGSFKQSLLKDFSDSDVAIDEGCYLSFAVSYAYGADILRECGLDPQEHLTENGCFPKEKFDNIVKVDLFQIESILDSQLFTINENWNDFSRYSSAISDIEKTFRENDGKELFLILQKCFHQFLMNDNPERPSNSTSKNHEGDRDKGLPLSAFVEKVRSLAENYNETDIYVQVIKLIDSGCATIYLNGVEEYANSVVSHIRDGEQAMVPMANLCPGLSYAIYTIYNGLGNKWNVGKERVKTFVERYLKKHGGTDILWSDVNAIMDSPNPGEYYMGREDEFLPSGDERADFFVAFSLAYVDFMEHEGSSDQMNFQDYLHSSGKAYFEGAEKYYQLLLNEKIFS
jgi:hypothetical protein